MKKLFILCATFVFATLAFQVGLFAGDHAAVGPEKCKMCHKVQFESWSKSKHAAATPPTTCENCHGNGADYMKMAIMKDPAQAKAAGLNANPDKAACNTCHAAAKAPAKAPATVTDEMMKTTHEHKAKK